MSKVQGLQSPTFELSALECNMSCARPHGAPCGPDRWTGDASPRPQRLRRPHPPRGVPCTGRKPQKAFSAGTYRKQLARARPPTAQHLHTIRGAARTRAQAYVCRLPPHRGSGKPPLRNRVGPARRCVPRLMATLHSNVNGMPEQAEARERREL